MGATREDLRKAVGHALRRVRKGWQLSLDDVEALFERMGALSTAQRARLPGMEPKRADVIVAGGAVVLAAMAAAGFDRLTVSDRGVRWGLLHDRFGG